MRRRRWHTSRATLWGLLGALLLIAGCFAPIAALPAGGVATLLSASPILSRLLVVAALSSLALLLFRRRRALLIPGAFAGLTVFAEALAYRDQLAVISDMGLSTSAILFSFTYEWGWALLAAGVALLILAGLFPGRRR